MLQPAPVFGFGFSCQSLTKENSARSKNKGCVKAGTGTSGDTFHKGKHYILRFRPFISFLENVDEVAAEYVNTDGVLDSDSKFIVDLFEKEGFFVMVISIDAREFGSPKALKRTWFQPPDMNIQSLKSFHLIRCKHVVCT